MNIITAVLIRPFAYGDDMNHTILNDNTTVWYVVKVDGREITKRTESKMIAEQALANLPEDTRNAAQVVPVTASGQQVLLG